MCTHAIYHKYIYIYKCIWWDTYDIWLTCYRTLQTATTANILTWSWVSRLSNLVGVLICGDIIISRLPGLSISRLERVRLLCFSRPVGLSSSLSTVSFTRLTSWMAVNNDLWRPEETKNERKRLHPFDWNSWMLLKSQRHALLSFGLMLWSMFCSPCLQLMSRYSTWTVTSLSLEHCTGIG